MNTDLNFFSMLTCCSLAEIYRVDVMHENYLRWILSCPVFSQFSTVAQSHKNITHVSIFFFDAVKKKLKIMSVRVNLA